MVIPPLCLMSPMGARKARFMGTCVFQGFVEVGWLVLLQVPKIARTRIASGWSVRCQKGRLRLGGARCG
jgi:hypothetical protein